MVGALVAGLVAGLVASVAPSDAAAQVVETDALRMADGRRALRQSAVVDAPLDSVWTAYTTVEGLRTFVAPVVDIDLRVGGIREASYDPDAGVGDPGNILNEILAYLPREMFAMRVKRTPPGFPFPEAVKELWTVVQLEAAGERRVRVTATMLGFGAGEPWDALYEAFERDNATELRRLVERFESGPVDWRRVRDGGR